MTLKPVCESLEGRRMFSAVVHQELHRPPRAVADVNGDGLADMMRVTIAINEQTQSRNIGFDTYLNDGKGNMAFATHTDVDDQDPGIPPNGIADAIVVADLDGDGVLDVAMRILPPADAGPEGPQAALVVFAGDGRGGYQQRASFVLPHVLEVSGSRYNQNPYSEDPIRMAAGDLDGDGITDLASWIGDSVVTVLLDAGGKLRLAQEVQLNEVTVRGWDPKSKKAILGLADLTGDGRPDLVAGIEDGLYAISLDFDKTGSPSVGAASRMEGVSIRQGVRVLVGDLDGDGSSDDVAILQNGGNPSIGLNVDGKFKWKQLEGPIKFSSRDVLLGDVDGDGADDFFTLRSINDAKKSVLSIIR